MVENGYVPPDAEMFIDTEHPAIVDLGDCVEYSAKKDEKTGIRALMMQVKEPSQGQDSALAVFAGASGTAEGLMPLLKASLDLPDGHVGVAIAVDSPRTAHNTDKKFIYDPRVRAVQEDELIGDSLASVPAENRPRSIIVNGNSAGAEDAIHAAATLDAKLKEKGLGTKVEALVLENPGGLYRQSNIDFYKAAVNVAALAAETRQLLPSSLDYAKRVRDLDVALQDPDKTRSVHIQHEIDEMKRHIKERDDTMKDLKTRALTREGITGAALEEQVAGFMQNYQELASDIDLVTSPMMTNRQQEKPISDGQALQADELEKRWQKLTQELVGSIMKSGADASGKSLTLAQFAKLGLDITFPKEGITKEVGEDVRREITVPVVMVFTDDDAYFKYESAQKAMNAARARRMEELHAARPDLSPAEIVEEANYFPNAPAVTVVRMQGGHQESDVHPEKVARVGMQALRRTEEALRAQEPRNKAVRRVRGGIVERIRENYPNISDAEADARAKAYYAQTRSAELREAHGMGDHEARNRARAELIIPQIRMTLHM